MRGWLAAACVILIGGSILADVADAAGRREGGRRGGGRHSYAGGNGETASISPDEIRQAQKALADRRLYGDAIDGVIGPKTVAALKAFQAAEGLPQTGDLDRESRARPGVKAPAPR